MRHNISLRYPVSVSRPDREMILIFHHCRQHSPSILSFTGQPLAGYSFEMATPRKPVKKTTFLEAVAAAIQHEKEVFEFYEKNAASLKTGPIQNLFYQLAEDVDDHIQMIGELYSQVKGGEMLPNLKMASEVNKLNTTSLQILMRRLDRNKGQNAGGDELEALRLATQEHEDAADFYKKISEKFDDPSIKFLFRALANFQEENRILLESYSSYLTQGTPYSQPSAYWEQE